MTTLAKLMTRDNVRAIWTWTHEVSTGRYAEYEMWDLLLIRDSHEPKRWVTDVDTQRTAYFTGIGGCQNDSRRMTGGERRQPDTLDTLADLLSDAQEIDNYPTFADWCTGDARHGPAHEQLATYEQLIRNRDTLRNWLPDAYDQYVNADRD